MWPLVKVPVTWLENRQMILFLELDNKQTLSIPNISLIMYLCPIISWFIECLKNQFRIQENIVVAGYI